MKKSKSCFHCGLPIPEKAEFKVKIFGEDQDMCCPGCQAVAEAIVDQKLENYYKNRSELPPRPDELVPEFLQQIKLFDREEVQKSFVSGEGDEKSAALILEGIVCAACAWLSESHVRKIPGVIEFKVNYSTHRANLTWDDKTVKLSYILQAIADIGYKAHPFDPNKQEEIYKKTRQSMLRRLVVAGIGAMQAMMLASSIYLGAGDDPESFMFKFLRWTSFLIATPVVFYSASLFFKSAWRDLKTKSLGMDVPVSLAVIIAYAASIWAAITNEGEIYFDSICMFVFFLLIGRFLELSARHKAGFAIDSMLRLTPAVATRKKADSYEEVAVIDLNVGDEVLIKPGSQVPADGIVLEGQSSVDESMLTGESMPLIKHVGDNLIGGTNNIESPLIMRVDKLGADTVLSSILRLLEKAQSTKPKIARLADQVAGYFVGFILFLSAITLSYWWQQDSSQAFGILISVLVVTCPCALSLATPAALTVATGKLGQHGILTASANVLEKLAEVSDVVFDKTGTLTRGKIKLRSVDNFTEFTDEKIISIARALEVRSEHPIAKALLKEKTPKLTASKLTAGQGAGISGKIEGVSYRIGSLKFVAENLQEISNLPDKQTESENITVYLADHKRILARLEFADSIRSDALLAINELKSLNIEAHLLSGDKDELTRKIANSLKIDNAQGNLLPKDKLHEVAKLQDEGRMVAMVGDGVNDAPVLAGADVSFAMGQGTSLAKVSSDMVLFSNKLEHIPYSVLLTRFMLRVIKQNISWAIIYNVVALPLAMAGYVEPWMAAIGMSLSSLLVVLNALRIRNK